MEEAAPRLSRAALAVPASPIQELSHLAQRLGAVNLAEGFPDFPAPPDVKAAAAAAIAADLNQYSHVQGICDHLAAMLLLNQGLCFDPLTDIVICCGQSEAFAAAIFATIDQGDEVLLFDPAYETYEACIALAGGVPVYVALDPPMWRLNVERFMNSFTSRTKVVVLNSPHNPTGKVFNMEELTAIAEACCKMNCFAITDEVYEYITFDACKHISLASIPGMQPRTIITSSLSKTYSVTGWRIGWACAHARIASAIRNIHVKLTDSAPAPFQEAALTALRSNQDYYASLRSVRRTVFILSFLYRCWTSMAVVVLNFLLLCKDYELKRDFIVDALLAHGFKISLKPQGSFFVFAELPEYWELSDVEFVRCLIKKAGVAAVPGRGFFHTNADDRSSQSRYIRFAFCKSEGTLNAAVRKLGAIAGPDRHLQLEDVETH